MKYYLFASMIFFFIACKNNKTETHTTDRNDSVSSATDHLLLRDDPDTLFITKTAAVYYQPDSATFTKWRKEAGEEDFATVVDDWSYYLSTSREYLDSMKLTILDADGKKVLKFIKADSSVSIVRLDTLQNFWGAYLFTPAKEPLYADIVMMDEEYKKYFGK